MADSQKIDIVAVDGKSALKEFIEFPFWAVSRESKLGGSAADCGEGSAGSQEAPVL